MNSLIVKLVIEVQALASMEMLPNSPVPCGDCCRVTSFCCCDDGNMKWFLNLMDFHLCKYLTLQVTVYGCDALSSHVRWKTGSKSFVMVNSTKKASVMKKVKMMIHGVCYCSCLFLNLHICSQAWSNNGVVHNIKGLIMEVIIR